MAWVAVVAMPQLWLTSRHQDQQHHPCKLPEEWYPDDTHPPKGRVGVGGNRRVNR